MKKGLLMFTLLFAFSMQVVVAQEARKVTGVVLDEDGEPIVGAAVKVKNGETVLTDADGKYELDVKTETVKVTISSYNLVTQEVTFKAGESSITTKLETSTTAINEIEVYGQKLDKRSSTGAVAVVTAADIAKRPVTDIIKAIDGSTPGIQVSSGGGQPGQTPDIQMRGPGSISGNQSPLIVLDGAPYSGSLVSINPVDVASMTFLKDATATALYGSRGANGVIVVTTKRGRGGKGGKPTISVDASVGVYNRFLPEYERVGAADYYALQYKAYAGADPSPNVTDFVNIYLGGYNAYNVPNSQLMVAGDNGKMVVNPNASLVYNDDWQDELQRTGVRQNYNIGVSNGDSKSDYYFSVGYTKDQGIVRNSDYDRFTTRLNLNTQVTPWLKTGLSLAATIDQQRFFLGGNTAFTNPFFTTRMMGPIFPVYRYDSTGNRMYEADGTTPVYDFGVNDANNPGKVRQNRPFAQNTNVIAALFQDDRTSRSLNGFGKAYVEIKFLKDFKFTTNFIFNYTNGIQDNFQNFTYGDASNVGGRLNRTFQTQYTWTFNQMLEWNPTSGFFRPETKNHLSVTAVHEAYLLRSEDASIRRTGFTGPSFKEGAGAAVGGGSSTSLDYQTLESYLALFSYDYDNKYYLTGNVRRDGTSRFSDGSRWGTFGSIGAGWIISEESFMRKDDGSGKLPWLNLFKIRGSYGITGQQDLGAGYYVSQSRYDFNHNGSHPGYTFTTWGNDTLQWEGKLKANIGFYAEILKNRMNINFDYFNEGSRQMLYGRPLASSTGVSSVPVNVGNMVNRGIEISINADIVRSKDFTYNTRINLTHLKNKITKVRSGDSAIATSFNILAVGKPYGSFNLPVYMGVNSQGIAIYQKDESGPNGATDGDADGVTTQYNTLAASDYKYAGAPYRDLDGSWTNNFAYKNFDLSFMIAFGLGGKFYDATYQNLMSGASADRGQAMHVDMLNAWDAQTNPNSDIPRINGGDLYANATSDRFLISNSFASLKNISFGYNFSPAKIKKLSLTSLRLYVQADNVMYFAGRKGVDLQQNLVGVSNFTYYPNRVVTMGLNIGL